MKSVTFLQDSAQLASARLRNIIPMQHLAQRGWKQGRDIVVLSKHNWQWTDDIKRKFGAVVFDVCDDWFDSTHGPHYRHVCSMADALTCNSQAMRERIHEVTGRDATVIDDPYEDPERPAGAGEGILWFGDRKGFPDLLDVLGDIEYPVTIISNMDADWCIRWTKDIQDAALQACRCVLIPPTRAKCRSANRAVTAIRSGRMVVAGDIPSYREIPGIHVGDDIMPALHLAMAEDMTDRIEEAQAYVAERFHPERIADQWDAALERLR